MAVTFVSASTLAVNATLPTQAITVPATSQANDLLVAFIINKGLTNVISPPDASWTQIYQGAADCTLAADDHRAAIFWKKATGSGGSFTFTKATDDNLLFGGVIGAWRGQDQTSPIEVGSATITAGASASVSFPSFDPSVGTHVVYAAFYGNDLTTFAAAMSSDVNPDCTKVIDLESSTGNDCSIAVASGDSDGTLILIRTWASGASAAAGSTGVVFGIKPSLGSTSSSVSPSVSPSSSVSASISQSPSSSTSQSISLSESRSPSSSVSRSQSPSISLSLSPSASVSLSISPSSSVSQSTSPSSSESRSSSSSISQSDSVSVSPSISLSPSQSESSSTSPSESSSPSMAAPSRITDQTSLQESIDIKTILQAKGIYPEPYVDQTFYYRGNLVLVISETQYGFRVLVSNASGGTGFDLITREEYPELVRAWSAEELTTIVAHYPTSHRPKISFSECEMVDGVCTHRIRFDGQLITATDTNKANAIAKAFIACLESE